MLDVVKKQHETGLSVVNDGEQGRADYTIYVKDRLTGFAGESSSWPNPDAEEFPEWTEMARQFAPPFQKRPACTGPVEWKDWAAVERDIQNLKDAAAAAGAEEVFMTSPSPGQIGRFLQNRYYPSDEKYLYTLADVMKREYRAIVDAGFVLQIDCPDLALGRHTQFAHLSLREFRDIAAMHVEVLDYAVADLPPDRMRIHVCWASTGGPHHRDLPLKDMADIVIKARPVGLVIAGANPRHEHEWKVWKDVKLPDGKVLVAGVIDSTTNFIEHPELVAERIERYAGVVGSRTRPSCALSSPTAPARTPSTRPARPHRVRRPHVTRSALSFLDVVPDPGRASRAPGAAPAGRALDHDRAAARMAADPRAIALVTLAFALREGRRTECQAELGRVHSLATPVARPKRLFEFPMRTARAVPSNRNTGVNASPGPRSMETTIASRPPAIAVAMPSKAARAPGAMRSRCPVAVAMRRISCSNAGSAST